MSLTFIHNALFAVSRLSAWRQCVFRRPPPPPTFVSPCFCCSFLLSSSLPSLSHSLSHVFVDPSLFDSCLLLVPPSLSLSPLWRFTWLTTSLHTFLRLLSSGVLPAPTAWCSVFFALPFLKRSYGSFVFHAFIFSFDFANHFRTANCVVDMFVVCLRCLLFLVVLCLFSLLNLCVDFIMAAWVCYYYSCFLFSILFFWLCFVCLFFWCVLMDVFKLCVCRCVSPVFVFAFAPFLSSFVWCCICYNTRLFFVPRLPRLRQTRQTCDVCHDATQIPLANIC